MSQQPVTLPPSLLIFNDLRVRGFWLSGGYAKAGSFSVTKPVCAGCWVWRAVLEAMDMPEAP
jgi:hypothetical protein